MRWAKFTAIASLWAFFFAFIVLVQLWITVLRIPNRWEIISRLTCSLTFLLRRILNINVTLVGDAGQLEGGGTVIISNHLSYVDGIVLGSIFPAVFVTKEKLRNGPWSVCGRPSAERFLLTARGRIW